MMNSSQVRVADPVLSGFAQGYTPASRVGGVLFPRVPVSIGGGKIVEFGKESFRRYAARRAPGANTKTIDFGYLGKPYELVQDSLNGLVPREYLRDAKAVPGIDLGMRMVGVTMNALTLALEIEQAEIATNPGNYDSDHKSNVTGADKWTASGSKPIAQIKAGIEAVRTSIGIRPNVAIFGAQALTAFEENASVTDRFKHTQPVISTDIIAALFRLEVVAVAEAVYADEHDNFNDVWGNNVILGYAPQKPSGQEQPSYGYTYTMNGNPLAEAPFWDGDRKSWVYGVTYERQAVLTGMAAGFLIQNPA